MSPNSSKTKNEAQSLPEKDAIWELIRTLVLGKAAAEDILEIYYWSRDPDILQMLRNVVGLPEENRRQVTEFFAKSNIKDISVVTQNSPRRLILTS